MYVPDIFRIHYLLQPQIFKYKYGLLPALICVSTRHNHARDNHQQQSDLEARYNNVKANKIEN